MPSTLKALHEVAAAQAVRIMRAETIEIFSEKLAHAGVAEPRPMAEAFIDHVRSGGVAETFTWGEDDDQGTPTLLSLEYTAEDEARVQARLKRFSDEEVPAAYQATTRKTVTAIVRSLRRRWNGIAPEHDEADWLFRLGLDARWGDGLDGLRLLLETSREMGATFLRKDRRRKRDRIRNAVLVRLHARGCQLTAEIIALLAAGFPDGAMARWRTLSEVLTVATLIADHGDDLAARYIEHEAVEHARAVRVYLRVQSELGERPLPQREQREIQAAYDAALLKHGPDFKNEYGWASVITGKASPGFADLEVLAGRSTLRSHYKFASYSVHAGLRGLKFQLGLPDTDNMMLTGPSNVGLEEPGRLTAHSLAHLSSLLISTRSTLQYTIEIGVLIRLRDQTTKAFTVAERDLAAEIA